MDYKLKYLKYKQKYLLLKQQLGGASLEKVDISILTNFTNGNIESLISSNDSNIKINDKIIRSFNFSNQEENKEIKLRSVFIKHIFRRYSELDLNKFWKFTLDTEPTGLRFPVIFSSTTAKGKGDISTIKKLYYIVKKKQEEGKLSQFIDLILLLPDSTIDSVKDFYQKMYKHQ